MATAASPRRSLMAKPLPPADLYSRNSIRFLHPGYGLFDTTLLCLPRVDRVAGTTTTFGVHYRTALLACQIIAGNAFDTGFLTLDKAGQVPVNLQLDDILIEDVYYLIVRGGPDQYPIVPSFQDWEFPHGRIPDSWPEVPATLIPPPGRCGISNFSFAIEDAHLVPQEEALWYARNDMGRYGDEVLRDINVAANILPLKVDIHRCFDKRWFAIVPKVSGTAGPYSPQYATHVLVRAAAELWPTHHNTLVQYLHPEARPYLFARFAWAVLLQVKSFIIAGPERHVFRIQTSDADKMGCAYKNERVSGSKLKASYGGGGSKRATPVNKSSGAGSMADDDGNRVESSSEDDDIRMEGDWEDMMHEWEQRGKEGSKLTFSETAGETAEEDNQARILAELETRLKDVLPRSGHDIAQGGR